MNSMQSKLYHTLHKPLRGLLVLLLLSSCSPISVSSSLHSVNDIRSMNPDYSGMASRLASASPEGLDSFSQLFQSLSCSNFESQYWSHIYYLMFNTSNFTPTQTLEELHRATLDFFQNNYSRQESVKKDISRSIFQLFKETFLFFLDKSEDQILEEIAHIELAGNSIKKTSRDYRPELGKFTHTIANLFAQIKQLSTSLHLPCRVAQSSSIVFNNSSNSQGMPFLNYLKRNLHPLVYGARKIMSIAYQSCDALDLPPISSNTPALKGIKKYSDPNGRVFRSIASLEKVNDSHYYLQNFSTHNSDQCVNISRKPLIYDFGGKPFVTQYPFLSINLFKDAGSGSKDLGLDCSGFVLSALAGSGLRIKSSYPMKAAHIAGVNSQKFYTQENIFDCFKKVNADNSDDLSAGDIIATNGHILIVDEVDSDPLGVGSIKSASGCPTQAMSKDQLDFSVIHSSVAFGGVGIHRVHVRDLHLSQLKTGLLQLASNLCYKKFNVKKDTQKNHFIQISRHLLTTECRELEMHVTNQECLSSCQVPL